MRTLAITGMVTVCMISRMTLMAAMRATPPSLRISEGTRSSAMTAHAPAFSAMRACSAVVTSIMTPPFSISARPTLTRHSFEPLAPLPLPFTFFASISLLLSMRKLMGGRSPPKIAAFFARARAYAAKARIPVPPALVLIADNHEARSAAREQLTGGIANLSPLKNIAAAKSGLERFDGDLLVRADGLDEIDAHFRGDGADFAKAANFAHRLIEQHGDDTAVQRAAPALIARS